MSALPCAREKKITGLVLSVHPPLINCITRAGGGREAETVLMDNMLTEYAVALERAGVSGAAY